MSEKDSWELFVKHAFNIANPYDHPKVGEIGKQIVRKCNGLPLAVKSLGILLSHQSKLEEWENIQTATCGSWRVTIFFQLYG